MREWNVKPGDKLTLTLAADSRISATDYYNDQVWELLLGGGSVSALVVQSTLGLRARSLRIFPRFCENEIEIMDPSSFAVPPHLTQIYPNYFAYRFSPFIELDVEGEVWVPQSDALAGRLLLKNNSHKHRLIRLDLIAQLTPTEGQRMAVIELDSSQVLWGESEKLNPVIYLTGGAEQGSGSFPALTRTAKLPPGKSQQFAWSLASCNDQDTSFRTARQVVTRQWDAERARMELLNSGMVQVFTGDPKWDFLFTISQNLAANLLVGPGPELPNASFVLSRQPDLGFSIRGDGTDYNHLWNGQSPFEAYYLANLILPGDATNVRGILQNFLSTQEENGFIDWKPGMAGQRSRLLATPMLATLAWRTFEASLDESMIREHYDGLKRFLQVWLSPEKDADGDGLPEWDHPVQMGFEDHPLYAQWHAWSAGLDISTGESPIMGAMLYREILSVLKMAKLLNLPETDLQAARDQVAGVMTRMWDDQGGTYQEIDRDSHFCQASELLGTITGNGTLVLSHEFDQPSRLLLHLNTGGETVRQVIAFVHGASATGQPRVERITGDQFKWHPGRGVLTGDRIYASIEKIEVQNIGPQQEMLIYKAGYASDNQGSLLPLWAGIPDHEQAKTMIEKAITNPDRFWRRYGIPAWNTTGTNRFGKNDASIETGEFVHLPWNALIGEGMIAYGYRSLAAELITRLMAGISENFDLEGVFRSQYHSATGIGAGERNTLYGLAPLGLFLETLGVKFISSHRVVLSGYNPFPWPVTVKYRGTSILKQKERTIVVFPDGQVQHIEDPAMQIVSLE